jgi:hypothetical protein
MSGLLFTQHLVGKDPEECEKMMISRWEFNGELTFVPGIGTKD